MSTLVFATRNPHKVRELTELIAPLGLEARPLAELFPDAPDVDETGDTFRANALLKAKAAYRLSGLPSVADDSGICVDHLGGAPGIYSARWAGHDEANNDRLLAELSAVPHEARGAHYACALALVGPPGFVGEPDDTLADGAAVLYADGALHGRIGYERRGTGGFGYDPLFVLEDGRTVAELPSEEKHAISHRGIAFRALVTRLRDQRPRAR